MEEEEEEEEVEEPEVEETTPQKPSKAKEFVKKLVSPLRQLGGKRRTEDLSPETVQEREAAAAKAALRHKVSSEASVVESRQPGPSVDPSLYGSGPPSTIFSMESAGRSYSQSSAVGPPFMRMPYPATPSRPPANISPYAYQLLEHSLRASQEDLRAAHERFASRESLLLEQITDLEHRLAGAGDAAQPKASGSKKSSKRK